MKLKGRLAQLQERIKGLQTKSAEHAKSLRLRDIAEKKCQQVRSGEIDATRGVKRRSAANSTATHCHFLVC